MILISNDDSIHAPGINLLAQWVKDLGEVYIVAPDLPQSGMSSAMTANGPLRITEHPSDDPRVHLFSVSGTPTDCVKIAAHTILPAKPDIMLSGINHGSNAGNSAIYSGTIGAAFEAAMQGIPAVGYSLLHHSWEADFSECRPFIERITRAVLEHGLPEDVCLNVNFPARVKIEGLKIVRAARSYWTDEFRQFTDPHGRPFWWLTGRQVNREPDADDTDLYWLARNYATLVPLLADQSYRPALDSLKEILE